jgi:hypothetical protein
MTSLEFARYASQRSSFTRWFVPVGMTGVAVMLVWQNPQWSWLNGGAVFVAVAMWVSFAIRLRYPNSLGVAKA